MTIPMFGELTWHVLISLFVHVDLRSSLLTRRSEIQIRHFFPLSFIEIIIIIENNFSFSKIPYFCLFDTSTYYMYKSSHLLRVNYFMLFWWTLSRGSEPTQDSMFFRYHVCVLDKGVPQWIFYVLYRNIPKILYFQENLFN